MTNTPDVIVIGGGIVGLATSLKILEAQPSLRLVLLEKENAVAKHQTGNNSGVIHSGLYYKPGSLKAINCRIGYTELLKFCQEEDVPFQICGKLVVATSEPELEMLSELHRRGNENGLEGMRFLGQREIREAEPYCEGLRALYVPQTGIVDYKTVAKAMAEKIVSMGGEIVLSEQVECIIQNAGHVEVVGSSRVWKSKTAAVCAGLYSDKIALRSGVPLSLRIIPFRGEYYKLKESARHLVNHLIYPVPDPAFPFLGVHFTRMLDGEVECGPNAVFAFGREAYKKTDFDLRETCDALMWPGFRKVVTKYWRAGVGEYYRSISKAAFVRALQKLVPDVREEHLEAGGAGIRAQACDKEGVLLDDFSIKTDRKVTYICNAPSPAATASLAIGNTIASHMTSYLYKD